MEEDSLHLCTVESIHGTTVFVKLDNGKKGTIVISEIAPGRIRNLRQYVVPNKKIVCKILRISNGNIELSLRRVNSKEKKEVMEKYKQEQTAKSAIHSILKEKAKLTEEKILKDFQTLGKFLMEAKENTKLIDKYIPKTFHIQIKKITEKKKKGVEVKKIINLKCLESKGIETIKNIMNFSDDKTKITYLSAGRYQLTAKGEDYKTLNKRVDSILESLEKETKKQKCEFSFEEKK
jgi:translation initiation factor 2 subunit 1